MSSTQYTKRQLLLDDQIWKKFIAFWKIRNKSGSARVRELILSDLNRHLSKL